MAGPKGARLADELLTLCELGTRPSTALGFEVRGEGAWLDAAQALAFDLTVLRAAQRHRREQLRQARQQDEQHKTGGINTVARSVRMIAKAGE